MDFDDNDFHGQSFQLGGEENKFPSSLQSFTLPKYDFDETLQVHLDFNGLEDTEDLLGIPNQQHNHWIEDFSRSSTRIEFDSSAPESCCISRHNNVWSEATSSESVEMLLKSVGQDEAMIEKGKLGKPVGGDDLASLNAHMDDHISDVERHAFIDTGPSLSPDVPVAQFISAKDDLESQPYLSNLEGKDNFSGNTVAVESSAMANCASIQNSSNVSSLAGVLKEDRAGCSQRSNLDVMENFDAGEFTVSQQKLHELEVNNAVDNVVLGTIEKINGEEIQVNRMCINSMEANRSPEDRKEALLYQRGGGKKADLSHGVSEHDIFEERELLDGKKKGGNECFSSLTADPPDEDGITRRNNKADSVVKVFSPADLIQVPFEIKKATNSYKNPGSDGESCLRNVVHQTTSDKIAENDAVPDDASNVPKNVVQEESAVQEAGKETSQSKEANSEDALSFKETGEMSTVVDLAQTTELKSDAEFKERRSLLPQIDVGGLSQNSTEEGKFNESDPSKNDCSSKLVDACLVEKPDGSSKAGSSKTDDNEMSQIVCEAILPLVALKADTADLNFTEQSGSAAADDPLNEQNNTLVDSERKDGLDILSSRNEESDLDDVVEKRIVDGIGEETVHVEVHNSASDVGVDGRDAIELVPHYEQGDGEKCDAIVLKSACETHTSEIEHSNVNEETCGSPIVISSQEQVQKEKESQFSDDKQPEPNVSVLDGTNVAVSVIEKSLDNVQLMRDESAEAEKSFTFEVGLGNDFSKKGSSQDLNSVSGDGQPGLSKGKEYCKKESISHSKDATPEPKDDVSSSKNVSGDKLMQASTGGTAKKTNTRARAVKQTSSRKRKAESSKPSSSSAENAPQSDPLRAIKQYLCTEGNNAKPASATTSLSSNVPDFNSANSRALMHQPFTDIQQVQLRAQIFVYGSLIQGTAPDETCMASAFGGCSQDSGRSTWESVWKLAVERFYSQKSPVTGLESPLYTPTGNRYALSKTSTSESCRRSGLFPSESSSPIHLSSPLWNAASQSQDSLCDSAKKSSSTDTHQPHPPSFPFQFPQMHIRGNMPTWPSSVAAPGSPWIAPSQRAFLDMGQGYPALSKVEPVQAAPAQDLSSNSIVLPISSALTANDVNQKVTSISAKSRKRRKNSMEESALIAPTNPLPGLVSTTSNLALIVTPNSEVAPGNKRTSPITSSHFQIVSAGGGVDAGQKAFLVEQTQSRIELAKSEAEDAARHAASAVVQCQDIWAQLSVVNNSGCVLDNEEKLASAAVAAAAGASVAKAAAAAAKIASEAVVQAKLMIDDALKREGDPSRIVQLGPSPKSNAKSKSPHNKSIVSATREAVLRRVENTFAAAKRAENLDAIVKASELAIEAVSQAGAIIAMGDPIPLKLKELLESGMHGYWKRHSIPSERKIGHDEVYRNEHLDVNDAIAAVDGGSQHLVVEIPCGEVKNGTRPNSNGEKMQQIQKQPNAGKAMEKRTGTGSSPDPSISMLAFDGSNNDITDGSKGSDIVESSHVEVRNVDISRGVWHLAKVLIVKDEEAFVCYDELLQNEGSEHLKEWIPLKDVGDEPPRIRIARSDDVALKHEGTRKRRRTAVGNNSWCIGDQVDVRMDSCWRTAMVKHKDIEDGTKLTVQFLDDKATLVVQTWDLLPSLVWNDGRWIEWSRQSNYRSNEGDSPLEKRQKLGNQETGTKVPAAERKNMSKVPVVDSSAKSERPWTHMLTEKDKIFAIGKDTGNQAHTGAIKMKRTGLQKEGSKVIFGIPKPGKRRKFMDVSKHCVAGKPEKSNETADSRKLVKNLMPQGSSRNWKNAPKTEFRGKQIPDNTSRVPRSGKLHGMPSKPSSDTEISSIPVRKVPMRNAKRSSSLEETTHESQPSVGVGSFSDDGRSSAAVELSSDALSSQKFSNAGANKDGKGKREASGKVLGDQEKRPRLNYPPPISNVNLAEPRRSNRMFQPTSRLLEGLQSSSLTVAKMPPVSLDKGSKPFPRSSS